MSKYTPTTRGVRQGYTSGKVGRKEMMPMAAKKAFDRWLSEHDRQVAERAWDEGGSAARENVAQGIYADGEQIENPYRAAKGEQK